MFQRARAQSFQPKIRAFDAYAALFVVCPRQALSVSLHLLILTLKCVSVKLVLKLFEMFVVLVN